ncbi:MAG: hypothetical protein HC933_03500 [Pleurocapsa sp. SU_196_0]|nr:hypothetical protein [Pleurocapsa sp. SU_196_0]
MTWASFVKNRLPILALPADLLEVMYRGELEYTKAAELGKVKDEALRSDLLERVLQLQLPLTQVRQLVAEAMNKPKVEPDTLGRLAMQTVKRLGERLSGLSLERRARAERLLQDLRALLEDA